MTKPFLEKLILIIEYTIKCLWYLMDNILEKLIKKRL